MHDGKEGSNKASALGALGNLDPREARRIRLLRALFVVGLVSWTSLAAWWATYFYRSVNEVRAATLRVHALELRLLSESLSNAGNPVDFPIVGPYERVAAPPADDRPFAPIEGGGFVVLSDDELQRLSERTYRKYVMLAGEGSLLIGLLFATLVVLYRSLLSEWRLNRQREAFVHAVTHELKTPIAGLRALLETVKSVPVEKDEQAQFMDMGLAELTRLDKLVANILLTARLEAHAWMPALVSLDVGAAVSRVVERSVLRFKERGGTLVLRTADVPVVRFDAEALETIVDNLLDNGLKYAQGAPRVEVTIDSDGPAGRVRVTVRDAGIGFPADEGPRLFEKFFRAGAGEVRVAKGSGLGLYIGRRLARACGGELSASSEGAGRGATFTLELPTAT